MKKNRLACSPMDAALDYLSDRARTVREVEENVRLVEELEREIGLGR